MYLLGLNKCFKRCEPLTHFFLLTLLSQSVCSHFSLLLPMLVSFAVPCVTRLLKRCWAVSLRRPRRQTLISYHVLGMTLTCSFALWRTRRTRLGTWQGKGRSQPRLINGSLKQMLIHVNTLRTNIDSPAECSPADIYKVSKYERQGTSAILCASLVWKWCGFMALKDNN